MSKSNTTRNDVMKAAFLGTDPSWRDIAGQANFYLALHTADPGAVGNQTTFEVSYTGYARVPVLRTAGGWTVSGNQAVNAVNPVQFPTCTGPGDNVTIRYVSIGLGDTGVAGQIIYSGQLTEERIITNGIQPQFAGGALAVTET
jgi:hypothetical protein